MKPFRALLLTILLLRTLKLTTKTYPAEIHSNLAYYVASGTAESTFWVFPSLSFGMATECSCWHACVHWVADTLCRCIVQSKKWLHPAVGKWFSFDRVHLGKMMKFAHKNRCTCRNFAHRTGTPEKDNFSQKHVHLSKRMFLPHKPGAPELMITLSSSGAPGLCEKKKKKTSRSGARLVVPHKNRCIWTRWWFSTQLWQLHLNKTIIKCTQTDAPGQGEQNLHSNRCICKLLSYNYAKTMTCTCQVTPTSLNRWTCKTRRKCTRKCSQHPLWQALCKMVKDKRLPAVDS